MSGLEYEMSKAVWFQNKSIKLSQTIKDGKLLDNFFRDEEEIKSKDETNEFTRQDFKKMITNEVQQFVHQSFDNIVVLVGAGASVTNNEFKKDENGIATSGVTVAVIAKQVLLELEQGNYKLDDTLVDVFTLDELSKKIQYMESVSTDGQMLMSDFNLEDFLSSLFAFERFVSEEDSEKFTNTKKSILDIIKRATAYDYNKEKFKHVKFLNVLSNLNKTENKLNVVTTNYDTLLEDAAESMKWTVFDGFSFSQTPQFDATMFEWNLVKNVGNVLTNERIYKKNVMNLLKIHGSLTWERVTDSQNIVRKYKHSINDPIMVFPSSDKYSKSYEEPYFELFVEFQKLLKEPNTLLITTGFSFADNHIAQMIINAIKTNDGLGALITDFNIESDVDNWNVIYSLMENSYNIAFLKATMNDNLPDFLGGKLDEN